jgi:dihydropteroate synthase
LIGVSRKGFIGELTGRPAAERLAGTLAAGAWSVLMGARILRVHDVRETADLVKVLRALTGKRR